MSPSPARTSRASIIVAARTILEADGLDAVTMQAVADRVGVRPPSLYKHVADRNALIGAVVAAVLTDLAEALRLSHRSSDPGVDLRTLAGRYRTFVRGNPTGYALLFARLDPEIAPAEDALAALGLPIVALTTELAGEGEALEAARTFVAWAHGFTSLEMAGGFRLGGDLDRAYATGIDLILAGISGPANPPAG
jgi:AcrR family transcriptional regulator